MANELLKKKATDILTDSARDYLTAKITLPLGDPALKKVHTNQWLFTDLPEEFALKYWEDIANALNAGESRYAGYVLNRWYIESVTIDVDAKGKAEMQLGLNAFASSTGEYSESRVAFEKAYRDATSQNTTTSSAKNSTSSTKTKSNAIASNDTALIKDNYVKKYNIPKEVVNAVTKACKWKKTDKDKAYAWYQWMDNNVGYDKYYDHVYNPDQVIRRGKGNCVDNSRTYRMGCLAMGIKCNYVKGFSCCAETCANHQWNKVYINGKGITVDCGRTCASWGSHWGNCSGGTQETTSSW